MATPREKNKARPRAGTGRASGRRASAAHRTFIYRIGILRRLLDRYSGPTLTVRSGLTLAQWRVLTNLYTFSPTTSRHLCLRLHTDKAEVSRACAGLIARGYARRCINASDRRSALIIITARGERLHDAIIPLRQALQNELEAPLTRTEVAELHRILDKLAQYVSGRVNAGSTPGAAGAGKRRRRRRWAEKRRRAGP